MASSCITISHPHPQSLLSLTPHPHRLPPPSFFVQLPRTGGMIRKTSMMRGRAAVSVVSATATEMPKKKRYPGESKGFVEEMRFVVMKLHTRDQSKEGEKEPDSAPIAKWEPTNDVYLKFLMDTRLFTIRWRVSSTRQAARGVAEKVLDKKELEFYKWDGDLSQLLQNVREKLNKVANSWTRDEKDHCLEETEKSFKYSGQILRLILS